MSEAICPYCPHCRRQNPKYRHRCKKCGLNWNSRLERPVQCTYCKSPHWDREVLEYTHTCNRCDKVWEDSKEHPIRCAGCRSPSWDREVSQKHLHKCKRCQRMWESELERPIRCTYCKSLAWTTTPASERYQIYFEIKLNGRYKRGIDGRVEMRLALSMCLCRQVYNRNTPKCPTCNRRGAVRFVSKVLTRAELLDMARKKANGEIEYKVQGVKLVPFPDVNEYRKVEGAKLEALQGINTHRKIEGEKLEGAVPKAGV